MGYIVGELFAFVVVDPQDLAQDEGIMAFHDPRSGSWIPMVGADLARVESLRPIADETSKQLNIPYRIKRFVYTNDIL